MRMEQNKSKERIRSGAYVPFDEKPFIHVRKGKIHKLSDSGGTGPNPYTMASLLLKNISKVCLLCKNNFAEGRITNSF